jgi:hypothetical protein
VDYGPGQTVNWIRPATVKTRVVDLLLDVAGSLHPMQINGKGREMMANKVAGLLTQMGSWSGIDK